MGLNGADESGDPDRASGVGPVANDRRGKSRREFLLVLGGGGILGALYLATSGAIKDQGAKVVHKLQAILPRPAKTLPAVPLDPAQGIPGLSKLITPNIDFYRIDVADNIPVIDINTWTLKITGMVKNPHTLTYSDLLKRPLFELDDTLSCVSNPVGGIYIGNARWLGCRLDDLIREAEPLDGADQILSSSEDGFSAGFPLASLDGRDAMIAVGMNGEVLPLVNGYPARIVVPGLYGYVSATKWLTNIELTRFDQKQGYWISRGWSQLAPVKIESRIDTPVNGSKVAPGEQFIAGVAWAPNAGVKEVQVQINGGRWLTANLGPQLSGTAWRQWWINWSATTGTYKIAVKAISATGEVQTPVVKDVLPDGAQGWHTIEVEV